MSAACRLYLITPPAIADLGSFVLALEAAFSGGDVAAVQLRLKPASDEGIARAARVLVPIIQGHGAAAILNDRPDLAVQLGFDGVHVGQGDASCASARQIVGRERMVGVTCHDSYHLAMEAAEAGCDYVAFGAFFPTTTKQASAHADPELLHAWQEVMQAPCVAIGGITAENARGLAAAGADFLAVSAGVWGHPGGPAAAVKALNAEIARGLEDRKAAGTGV